MFEVVLFVFWFMSLINSNCNIIKYMLYIYIYIYIYISQFNNLGIGIEKNINQRMWPHVLYMINKSNYTKIEVVSVIINFRMFNMSTFSCYT